MPLPSITTLSRALAYANTFGYAVWLRPRTRIWARVWRPAALATRMGLAGVPVAAETIALHTIFELIRGSQTRVHLCRISSAAGVELVRRAKAEGLNVTADVSINSLLLTENDIGYFDSSARVVPCCVSSATAMLSAALADGTIDALVSDHCPVDEDAKVLPFAEAEPGATGVELLLSVAVKWSREHNVPLSRALAVVTSAPVTVLGNALGEQQSLLGQLKVGGVADLCIVDPAAEWTVEPKALASQGKSTPLRATSYPPACAAPWWMAKWHFCVEAPLGALCLGGPASPSRAPLSRASR